MYAWTTGFTVVGGWLLLGLAVIAVATCGLGYLTSAIGARGLGAFGWGMAGAVVGGLAGLLLLGPLGILMGPCSDATQRRSGTQVPREDRRYGGALW